MKKLIFIGFTCSLLLAFSCKQKTNENVQVDQPIVEEVKETPIPPTWKFDSLAFSQKVYVDNDSTKPGMTISLFYKYPIETPDSINLADIQIAFAKIFSNKDATGVAPNDIFMTMVNEYRNNALEYAKEWEKENNPYIDFSNFDQSIFTTQTSLLDNIMTVATGQSSYLGGAHGAFYIKYENIDLRDGSIIKEDKFFTPKYATEVARLIQKEIQKRNNSQDENDHIALLTELKDIKSSQNFALVKNGMVYVYNQYEIAPYVQGPVEVVLPYKEILPLVSKKYKPIIENIIYNDSIAKLPK